MRLLLFILLITISGAGFAQSSKKKEKKRSEALAGQGSANSLNPYYAEKTFEQKKSSKKTRSGSVTYNAERKYYERVEAVAKSRRKTEKIADSPQYSDPLYFGHKRPPKKRPPGKMKFCKECGIRH